MLHLSFWEGYRGFKVLLVFVEALVFLFFDIATILWLFVGLLLLGITLWTWRVIHKSDVATRLKSQLAKRLETLNLL